MSPAKSLFQLRTIEPYVSAIRPLPLDVDPNGPADRPASRRASRISYASRAWHAIAQLAFEAQAALPHLLPALISFVISEFLQGCAAYAQAMHPIHLPVTSCDDPRERTMPAQDREAARPAATTTRLVLVVTKSGRELTFDNSPDKSPARPT